VSMKPARIAPLPERPATARSALLRFPRVRRRERASNTYLRAAKWRPGSGGPSARSVSPYSASFVDSFCMKPRTLVNMS
jgi:hypothetical protein